MPCRVHLDQLQHQITVLKVSVRASKDISKKEARSSLTRCTKQLVTLELHGSNTTHQSTKMVVKYFAEVVSKSNILTQSAKRIIQSEKLLR